MATKQKAKKASPSATEFIDAIANDEQRADAKALVKLMQAATGEKPKMWGSSLVGFGLHHYRYASGREGDMPKVAFSPRKTATVLYLGQGEAWPKELMAKLGKHSTGVGCLYIKRLADVDVKVLGVLVRQKVAARPG